MDTRRDGSKIAYLTGAAAVGTFLLCSLPASAQFAPNQNRTATGAVDNVAGTVGNTAGQVAGQVPGTVGQAGQAVGSAVGQLGNTAGNVVNGLQPTLQPVGQGVGNALNNLTQPDTVSALLDFLSSIIPNHIEAHVNLDALRVDKVTLDIRGVDLRNLRVDLLVANSRGAGQVQPMMGQGSQMGNANTGGNMGPSLRGSSSAGSPYGYGPAPATSGGNFGGGFGSSGFRGGGFGSGFGGMTTTPAANPLTSETPANGTVTR
jgi:hypothetical protein